MPEDPLREFLEVMVRLRAECPWKAEQTHRSLARYLRNSETCCSRFTSMP